MQRKFDLNIGKVLEDWEVHHALREIIANWLDEKVLRKTKDIKIEIGDFRDPKFVDKIIKKYNFSCIFHLGAQTQVLKGL